MPKHIVSSHNKKENEKIDKKKPQIKLRKNPKRKKTENK